MTQQKAEKVQRTWSRDWDLATVLYYIQFLYMYDITSHAILLMLAYVVYTFDSGEAPPASLISYKNTT